MRSRGVDGSSTYPVWWKDLRGKKTWKLKALCLAVAQSSDHFYSHLTPTTPTSLHSFKHTKLILTSEHLHTISVALNALLPNIPLCTPSLHSGFCSNITSSELTLTSLPKKIAALNSDSSLWPLICFYFSSEQWAQPEIIVHVYYPSPY